MGKTMEGTCCWSHAVSPQLSRQNISQNLKPAHPSSCRKLLSCSEPWKETLRLEKPVSQDSFLLSYLWKHEECTLVFLQYIIISILKEVLCMMECNGAIQSLIDSLYSLYNLEYFISHASLLICFSKCNLIAQNNLQHACRLKKESACMVRNFFFRIQNCQSWVGVFTLYIVLITFALGRYNRAN